MKMNYSSNGEEMRNNLSVISNLADSKLTKDKNENGGGYNNGRYQIVPRLLPSITSSARAKHRRNISSHRSMKDEPQNMTYKGSEKKGKGNESLDNSFTKNNNSLNSHETAQFINEGNLNSNSSNGRLMASMRFASGRGGWSRRVPYNNFNNQKKTMTVDQYSRGSGPYVAPQTSSQFPQNLNINNLDSSSRSEDRPSTESSKARPNNGHSMYPQGRGTRFSKRLGKSGWQTVKKTSRNVLPMVRRTSTGCCQTYVTTVQNIQNKWSLMFLVHCSLFLLFAGYIFIGASMFKKLDAGAKYAVSSSSQSERAQNLQKTGAEKLLNVSLKAVLEKSRDAVLDTIFTSDTLQAALSVFQTSRIAFLPADHTLELLSQDVLAMWEKSLNDILYRYHYITTMETLGFQLNPEQLNAAWGHFEEPATNPMKLQWTFWEATVQSFCLVTSIGLSFRSPTDEGRAAAVLYVIIGLPFYLCIVTIWSRRLLEAVTTFAKASSSRNRSKIAGEENRVPTPHWNIPPQDTKNESTTFIIFSVTTLTIAYVIGLGPVACGSASNSFGERLEMAFLSLLTVRPPHPLPVGGESSIGFILYILTGHIVGLSFLRVIKMRLSEKFEIFFCKPGKR